MKERKLKVHLMMLDGEKSACGLAYDGFNLTCADDVELIDCGNCKRTKAYKVHGADFPGMKIACDMVAAVNRGVTA